MENVILILVGLFAANFIVMRVFGDREDRVCTRCHYVGQIKSRARGSIAIEIVLWLFLIVPGIVYSIWRSKRELVCPSCGSKDLVPVDSPRGRAIVTTPHS